MVWAWWDGATHTVEREGAGATAAVDLRPRKFAKGRGEEKRLKGKDGAPRSITVYAQGPVPRTTNQLRLN